MNSANRWSLLGRALVALLLTVGFYTLALGIAFGLLYLIYLEVVVVGRVNIRLTVGAFIGAVVILWAIFPRIDRFEPPGPRLTRQNFPDLFKQIEGVARSTRQSMPRDVYLIPDVNAFVAERGGFMGIGSRRVMGIGLPLFHLVTINELRSILAHEFGHFYGGDTALGPWIYKTRAAIIRTVMSVGQTSQLLQAPFNSYAKMFLRVTNAISRQQEFTADALSARVVGRQIAVSGLQKIHRYGVAFQSFFQQEYAPVLNAGFQAPMIQGFERFIHSPSISEAISKMYEEQLTKQETNPYDTHPSLKERIAALESLPTRAETESEPAHVLLANTYDLERQLLKVIAVDKDKVKSLKEINWEDTTEKIFLPQWEKSVKIYSSILKDLTTASLPELAGDNFSLFVKAVRTGKILPANVEPKQVAPESQVQIVNNVLGAGLAVALHRDGWQIETCIGQGFFFVKGDNKLEPFRVYLKLLSKEWSGEQWMQTCSQFGIADLKLGNQ